MAFSRSWSSTLALAYAQKHPPGVGSLVIRVILTVERQTIVSLDVVYKICQNVNSTEFPTPITLRTYASLVVCERTLTNTKQRDSI